MQFWHQFARLSVAAFVASNGVATLQAQVVTAAAAAQRHGVLLDTSETAAVERGDAVVRVLPTQNQRDVAVVGLVRIGVTRDSYLRRVLSFRSWLRTPTRTRFGVFSEPAMLGDVDGVVVDRDDARDLRKCRAGDCTTKLPAIEIQRVQGLVDFSASDLQSRITALARQRLIDYVEQYRALGNSAMPVYDDRPSIRASDAFSAVLAQSAFLSQTSPAVATYLKTFPRGRAAGMADVLYWSEDEVAHLRPILSVTHMVVYTPPELSGSTVVVSKQIYANHYFEAAIEVRKAIDRDAIGEPASTYLVVERRFRFDNLPRGGILNIRGRAVNGLRDQLLSDLRRERGTIGG